MKLTDQDIDDILDGKHAVGEPAAGAVTSAPVIVPAKGGAGAREYTLLVPLKVDGRWLKKIRMRLPTQGDIDDWGNGEIASMRAFLCRLTGLHPAVIKALAWPDSAVLHEVFHDVVPGFVIRDRPSR